MAIARKKAESDDVFEITLDSTNIANKYVLLPKSPKNIDTTTLDVIGGSAQSYNTDFHIIEGNKLTWFAMGLESVVSAGDKIRIIFHN